MPLAGKKCVFAAQTQVSKTQSQGLEVTVVHDGLSAIAAIVKRRPHAVLLDIPRRC
jgi:hypothetical protein